MKKVISIFLSVIMLLSCMSTVQLSANAANYDTAPTLALNGQWSDDYYIKTDNYLKIILPQDGLLQINLLMYDSYFTIDILNEKLLGITGGGGIYSGGTPISPKGFNFEFNLSSGTYYINLGFGNGKFKIACSFINYNTNDMGAESFDNQFIIPQNYLITGAITETNSDDWFKVIIDKKGKYIFTCNMYKTSSFYLYNKNLTQDISGYWDYSGGTLSSPRTVIFTEELDKGTYYLKVSGYKGKYQLSWAALTPANCSHDYSSSTVYATYVAKGYTKYVCKNCGYTYKANYTAKNKLSKPTIYTGSGTKGLKKALKVSYSSIYNATGYQIQYSTDKNFKKNVKTVSSKNTAKTIKKLKSKKKYYVRVRAYVKQSGKTAYSAWSAKKTIKTK